MKIKTIRHLGLFLVICLFCLLPVIAGAASERRIALVIGNSAYSAGPLKNPVNDASDMAAALQQAGFTVILKSNARLQEMEDAIENFGERLKRGGVGLFYFAGHGLQVNGLNYLIPIGAKINKESDIKYQSVDVNKILDEMANASNGLNIVMLDACRDNPFSRSFRNTTRGLAIVSNAPTGTFISYSTGPGQVARDGDGRNSPYISALIQYMKKPSLTIEDVFKGVRQKLRKETGQVPWELSSLEGKFYFTAPSAAAHESSEPEEAERPASRPIRETTEIAMGARPSVTAFDLQGTWVATWDNNNEINISATGQNTFSGRYTNINNDSIFQGTFNGSSITIKQLYSNGRLYGTYTFDFVSSELLKGSLVDYVTSYNNVVWRKK
jgi:hypothetical protein